VLNQFIPPEVYAQSSYSGNEFLAYGFQFPSLYFSFTYNVFIFMYFMYKILTRVLIHVTSVTIFAYEITLFFIFTIIDIFCHTKRIQVARVRNALAYATHKFFQENGFVWISSPIITASDCEGAGEQFCVTTLVFPIPRSTSNLYEYF